MHTGNNPRHEDVVEAFGLDWGPLLTAVYEAEELQTHKFQRQVQERGFFLFFSFPSLFFGENRMYWRQQAGREWLKP